MDVSRRQAEDDANALSSFFDAAGVEEEGVREDAAETAGGKGKRRLIVFVIALAAVAGITAGTIFAWPILFPPPVPAPAIVPAVTPISTPTPTSTPSPTPVVPPEPKEYPVATLKGTVAKYLEPGGKMSGTAAGSWYGYKSILPILEE
ncbi:MAG: hypothetical protein LBU38_06090, partial [Propionibacteriaceae bacterium]|nr:hypothetical protein [Propionibacteriaceae bacterium]